MVVNEKGILRCLQLQTTVCSALCRIRANIHTTTIELVMFISQLEQLNFMQVFLVSVRVVTRMNGHSRLLAGFSVAMIVLQKRPGTTRLAMIVSILEKLPL